MQEDGGQCAAVFFFKAWEIGQFTRAGMARSIAGVATAQGLARRHGFLAPLRLVALSDDPVSATPAVVSLGEKRTLLASEGSDRAGGGGSPSGPSSQKAAALPIAIHNTITDSVRRMALGNCLAAPSGRCSAR